jgi:hypothetical protein
MNWRLILPIAANFIMLAIIILLAAAFAFFLGLTKCCRSTRGHFVNSSNCCEAASHC